MQCLVNMQEGQDYPLFHQIYNYMENKKLKMSFDPHTIEHLGIKMYSVLPNAIAELIANAYDAEAHIVYIKLYDIQNDKRIVVTDDGIGMSFDEINNNFLRIGRKWYKKSYW